MKNTIIERLKSPAVWLAVLAQVVIIVGLFAPDVADKVKIIGTCIIEIVTMFGVLNDPTNRGGF